jgi:predicted metal-dependent phosphoesterase TrpH
MRIDLHTHSTASDGTDAPGQLVRTAAAARLDVVAITDHDTTAGWAQALAARPPGLTVVPGVEFSCVYAAPGERRVSLHLLAYLVDETNVALVTEWQRLRAARRTRGRRMVENLEAAGYPISWAAVTELAGDATIGRPHLGRALVAAGVVPDVDTAFRDLLSSRQPYYVRKPDTDVFDALALVVAAGGLPVFAHPLARRRGPVVSDDVIEQMTRAGLVGLEVEHPDHDAADREHAARLARDLDLVGTGSSDYHGANKPTPIAACTTHVAEYERLLAMPAARVPIGD